MKRVLLSMAAWTLSSCGVVGAPVPPENVGVAPTIEMQKKRDREVQRRQAETAAEGTDPDPALQGQDENLPPLRPVGTR